MNYALTRYLFRPLSGPIGRVLARTSVTPLQVTLVAAFLTFLAAFGFAIEAYLAAGVVTFVAEVFDCVDGDLARLTSRSSKAGAFLDSVLDRWTDAALIIGITVSDPETLWGAGVAALTGSLLASYTRARAQGVGTDCPEGIGGRDTRTVLIVLGGVTGQVGWALVAVAVVGFATALQRFVVTIRRLRGTEELEPAPVQDAVELG